VSLIARIGGGVNSKFLETFIWVARLRSFSLAADKLHATQAAVSSRIQALESELDVKLFMRDPKGAILTREGERVLHHAEEISASIARLRRSLRDDSLATGAIRIGAMDSAVHAWFCDFVADANHEFPNLDVEVTVDTALILNGQLRKGSLDFVFQTDVIRDEAIQSRELFQMPLAWIGAQEAFSGIYSPEALWEPNNLDPCPLVQRRLITYSRHSRPHQDLVRYFEKNGLSHARISCVNSVAAMIKLAQTGFGICVMPPALLPPTPIGTSLSIFRSKSMPPALPFVASWRTASEWADQLNIIADQTIKNYTQRMGSNE